MALETGIPKLDDLLEGGIAENKTILFYASPGVENLPFAFQLLFNRLEKGDHVLYVVNNKKPDAVRFMLKSFHWDISVFEKKKKFAFLDAYSGLMGLKSKERFQADDVSSIENIKENLNKALKDMKNSNTTVIFDSLSNFFDLCGSPKEIIRCLKECLPKIVEFHATPIFLFTAWAYDKNTLNMIRKSFDCVIDLKAIERKVILRNYFSIHKADWLSEVRKHDVPFKVTKPGGVKVYIPKVVVTGPFNAGKTSFIHSASTRAVSVERFGTTVALDHGHVDFGGFSVDLFGTPGQERFDPILNLLGGESLGVIMIVDSTNPKRFSRAKDMLEKTRTRGLPTVIAANKSNLKGALDPSQIRKKMNIEEDVPIVPVIAEDLKQVEKDKHCKLRKEDIELILSKLFEMVV